MMTPHMWMILRQRAAERIQTLWTQQLGRSPYEAAQLVLGDIIADRAEYAAMGYPDWVLCGLEDATRDLMSRFPPPDRPEHEATALYIVGQAAHGLLP